MSNRHVLSICEMYRHNAKKPSCESACGKLHVCQRWMGGCCREPQCEYEHSLRTEHNEKVIQYSDEFRGTKICDDASRFKLRKQFPATCFFYNYSKRQCTAGSTCDRLHICARFVVGQCADARCGKNHSMRTEQITTILYRYEVAHSDSEDVVMANILASDSPEFEKTCRCEECRKNKQERTFLAPSVSSVSFQRLGGILQSVTYDSDEASDRTSRTSRTNATDGDSASDCDDTIKLKKEKLTVEALTQVVVESDGITSFSAVSFRFGLADDYDLATWLQRKVASDPASSQFYPIAFVWDRQRLLTIQPLLRFCIAYNYLTACRDEPHCGFLHVCFRFIAGLCEDQCPLRLSHKLEGEQFRALGIDGWSTEKKLRLVREAHPRVCHAYNTAEGCSAAEFECGRLHICNRMVLGSCDESCGLNHDFSEPTCRFLLERFRLSTAKYMTVRQTTLPCCNDDSQHTHKASAGDSAKPEQPVANWLDRVDTTEVVKFCIAGAASPCFATYDELTLHFGVPWNFDWRAWCLHVRKSTMPDYEPMHNFYLHPIAFEWRNCKYLTVANAFRLCAYHQDPHCIAASCPRLHVCARYIGGACTLGDKCRQGHASAVEKCKVFEYLRLGWSTERKVLLLRAAHPSVCSQYAFRNCDAGDDCTALHVCNDWVLRRCVSCSRNHSLRTEHERDVLLRYGMHEMNENGARKLILPTSREALTREVERVNQSVNAAAASLTSKLSRVTINSLNAVHSDSAVRTSDKNSRKREVLMASSTNESESECAALSEPLFKSKGSFRPVATADSKVLQANTTPQPSRHSDSESERTAIPTSAHVFAFQVKPEPLKIHQMEQVAQQSPVHDVQDPLSSQTLVEGLVEIKEGPFVCERNLRDVCEFEETECSLIHHDKAYYWLFRLSDDLLSEAEFDQSSHTRVLFYNDNQPEVWFAFDDAINDQIERCFVQSEQTRLPLFFKASDAYPFVYNCEVRFAADRHALSFLQARVKLRAKQDAERPRAPALRNLPASSAPRCSALQDIAVRCARTKSHAVLPALCTRATRWQWFYRLFLQSDEITCDCEKNDELWLQLGTLIGDANVDELEYQYANGARKHTARTKVDKTKWKVFEFDLDSLLFRCVYDTGEFEAELRCRPSKTECY